jgi:hypothetical protein
MIQLPAFERYQRLLLQNAYIALQARVRLLNLTAEEKILEIDSFLS